MLIPNIHFMGNCNEAIDFYKKALGAEVKRIEYAKDAPQDAGLTALPPDFVMYSEVVVFGTLLNLSDGANEPVVKNDNFTFAVVLKTSEEVTSVFNGLAEGGEVVQELAPQFWSALYGMVKDRFGVTWQVYLP